MPHCAIVQVRRCDHKTIEDSREVTVLPSFDMLLFGGTGDLVTRKLLPALYRRFAAGPGVRRVAHFRRGAHRHCRATAYMAQAETACREFLGKEFDANAMGRPSARCSTTSSSMRRRRQDYAALPTVFKGRDDIVRVFFFSTASNLFAVICQNLAKAEVVTPLSRVVLEKPLGHDSASADLINTPGRRGVCRKADLPHRSLSRQGSGAKSHGAALRQRAVRTAVAPRH